MSSPPEPSGRDRFGESRKLMESMLTSLASSVGGRAELPRQLVEPMRRQLELVQELVERERKLQREIAGRLVSPFDAMFDLLEESGAMLRSQAEALEAAGQALGDAARLVKTQADLFERTIGVLRQPTEIAKAAAGLEPRPRRTQRGKASKRSQKGKASQASRPRQRKAPARKSGGGRST